MGHQGELSLSKYLFQTESSKGMPLASELVPAKKAMASTLVLLPGKSHGRRSLVGCSPWGHEELDTTGRLTLIYLLTETEPR